MSDMIPYWADQIDVFMIKITVKVPETISTYQYRNGPEWIKCHRIINHKQPVCMPS
jgi:hypothetical protein